MSKYSTSNYPVFWPSATIVFDFQNAALGEKCLDVPALTNQPVSNQQLMHLSRFKTSSQSTSAQIRNVWSFKAISTKVSCEIKVVHIQYFGVDASYY